MFRAVLLTLVLAAFFAPSGFAPSSFAQDEYLCKKKIPTTCMTSGGDSPGYVLVKACYNSPLLPCNICSNTSPASLCAQEYAVCKGGNCKGCYTLPRGMRSYVKTCCNAEGVCTEGEY